MIQRLNSLEIAHKRGIKIVWTIQSDSNAHPNTTKITVKMYHKQSVTGVSIGGGKYLLTELNGQYSG